MRRFLAAIAASLSLANGAGAEGRYPSYFFPKGDVYEVRVSPTGEWVAAAVTDGERTGLFAQRVGEPAPRLLQAGDDALLLSLVTWTGPNTLLVRFDSSPSPRWVRIRLSTEGSEDFDFEAQAFEAAGQLVDALPFSDGEVLWGIEDRLYDYVYRVALEDLIDRSGERPAPRERKWIGRRVARIQGSVRRWLVDSNEVVRAALRTEENSYTIFHRPSAQDRFQAIANFAADARDLKNPFGFTRDGSKLIVAARDQQATIGIYEFDPVSRTVGREIFSSEGLDVEFVHIDPLTRNVLSFTYSDGAETRRAYVEQARERFGERLGSFEAGMEAVQIVSSSADRDRFVFRVKGANDPGTYYFRNAPLDETVEIGRTGPSIARHALADMQTFTVVSKDGLEIEALLTLPSRAGAGPFPLVVMPHGGPIGVHDRREYRPDVQYLASWGYAVLQANYRGSSGYGRSFTEAGLREWARGIEDDLEAAILASVARGEIDGSRVCIVGSSYGGFSALASALRHPDWFDCAVTINGVTDVPLIAETSDTADSRRALEKFEQMVGDLERERDQLLAISPAYHVEALRTPVMVAFGERDRRVDRDHAERLLAMLELYGHEHEIHRIDDGRHSLTPEQWTKLLPAIRRFLDRHMRQGPPEVDAAP